MKTIALVAKPYEFETVEARSYQHPVFEGVTKHTFLIKASKLPSNLPTGANAREPVGMNRRVYRDVSESLKGNQAWPGSFDLMNLGITILADRVDMVEKGRFNVYIRDEDGIVNGAHTSRIIDACKEENSIPDEQHVEVRIITGINKTPQKEDLKVDIAKGQNTGIAVKDQSIYDIQGIFDGIKSQIEGEAWFKEVAWRESDTGAVDVRDLIAVMEALNVKDFPNESSSHPIHAYEKPSKALDNYANDFKANLTHPSKRTYAAFEPLLIEALALYDHIRRDFRDVFNKHVNSSAGRLRILEESAKGGYSFMYSGAPTAKYRLTKGAAFPILAAFRNCVTYDPKTNVASWIDGFDNVLKLWEEIAPELVEETYEARKDVGHLPDQLGKSRGHWSGLHRAVEVRMLRRQLKRTETSKQTTKLKLRRK